MPKHQAYPAAFREQLVALVNAGRSPEALAKEFEPTAQTIRIGSRKRSEIEGRASMA